MTVRTHTGEVRTVNPCQYDLAYAPAGTCPTHGTSECVTTYWAAPRLRAMRWREAWSRWRHGRW